MAGPEDFTVFQHISYCEKRYMGESEGFIQNTNLLLQTVSITDEKHMKID